MVLLCCVVLGGLVVVLFYICEGGAVAYCLMFGTSD